MRLVGIICTFLLGCLYVLIPRSLEPGVSWFFPMGMISVSILLLYVNFVFLRSTHEFNAIYSFCLLLPLPLPSDLLFLSQAPRLKWGKILCLVLRISWRDLLIDKDLRVLFSWDILLSLFWKHHFVSTYLAALPCGLMVLHSGMLTVISGLTLCLLLIFSCNCLVLTIISHTYSPSTAGNSLSLFAYRSPKLSPSYTHFTRLTCEFTFLCEWTLSLSYGSFVGANSLNWGHRVSHIIIIEREWPEDRVSHVTTVLPCLSILISTCIYDICADFLPINHQYLSASLQRIQ